MPVLGLDDPTSPRPHASFKAQSSRLREWAGLLGAFGWLLGLALGTAGQLATASLGASADSLSQPLWYERVLGVMLTAGGWAVAGALVGLVSGAWRRGRTGRVLASALAAAVAGAFFFVWVLGTAVRLLTGTYLTVGALEFCASSPAHLLRAAVTGYGGWLASLLVVQTAFMAVCVVAVQRAGSAAPSRSRATRVLLGAALGLSVLSVVATRWFSDWAPRAWSSTPELAFVTSLHSFETSFQDRQPPGSVVVTPGPVRSSQRLWDIAVRQSQGPRPNLLLLTLESVPVSRMGYAGYAREVTPHLDELAKAGLVARRAWTTATHSNYAQMAILSSLFPRRGKRLDMYHRLDYPRMLLHDVAHRLGYVTATISSQDETWQGMLRFQSTSTPTYFWHAGDYQGRAIDTGAERLVPDADTVAEAIGWLDKHRDKRWSLYVNLQLTHFPYRIPPDAPKPYQPDKPPGPYSYLRYGPEAVQALRNRYDNALAYVDAQVGKLRDYLQQTGDLDDTLWVITADHGELFHEHGMVTHGKTLFEGEARVPLILHWPAQIEPGYLERPVSHLDILPTVADLLELPPHPSFQGRSVFEERRRQSEPAILMNIQGLRSVDGIVCYPWKLLVDRSSQRSHLYHLERDEHEHHNVAKQYPAVASKLSALLDAQIRAQLVYHEGQDSDRATRFQPRMVHCPPELAEQRR